MRKLLVVPFIVAAILVVTTTPAAATSDHCVVPGGPDLNVFYGVSHQIVAPFCTEIGAGEEWSVAAVWIMNFTFAVVPTDFRPAGPTPLDDFVAKFVGVKYVVDPGTAHEKTYLFKNKRRLWTGVSLGGFPQVQTLTMGTIQPLSVGQHVVKTFWVFSEMHCDGFDAVLFANCIPAGETHYSTIAFEVKGGQS